MNYGELRTYFFDLLNRNDCTSERADQFISLGLRRTERLLRTPLQRTTLEKTIDGTWVGYEPAPIDYLGVYTVAVNDIPVSRIMNSQKGDMNGFVFEDGKFTFYPDLKTDDKLEITYFQEFDRGVADSALTRYSVILPDVTVYSALVFAGDFYIDARTSGWESRLSSLIMETQMMSDIDDIAGGGAAVTPYGGGIA